MIEKGCQGKAEMETDDLLQQPLKEKGVEAEEGEEKDSAMIPRREVKEKKKEFILFCDLNLG